ncbi:sugar transferase [Paenibacillus sp. IB182496]|uniref:Sugar transferase n=1 Tax=Paenibacillus sabuli TaxID=2772509 RepID=A0A927GVB2_9BACL|nr:sugar transferase [Paenibacillus sabuli]MBD2848567.1 sugar transferase [Paenibacillus sabuli]
MSMPAPGREREMAADARGRYYTGERGPAERASQAGETALPVYLALKRLLDVGGSIAGLIVLAPLFLVVAIGIKLEDPHGAVLFRQVRIGKDGRPFRMLKFRSMVADAEAQLHQLMPHNETSGAMFKIKDDPRITRIGRFIRRTSIDELPQLWNVLTGEMSLVGPRPPLSREVDAYTAYDMQRLAVTPGCTGLWQVSGRSRLGFAEMVELDLTYIRTRSIRQDIWIMLRTLRMLLGSKDAY